jgi:hypothetical protein
MINFCDAGRTNDRHQLCDGLYSTEVHTNLRMCVYVYMRAAKILPGSLRDTGD